MLFIILLYSYFQTRRENGRKRSYEVVFYNQYVQHHPWGDRPRPYNHEGFPLSVSRLCHTTHREQADKIMANKFRFTPNHKYGKTYDLNAGQPIGESYFCDQSAIPKSDRECYEYIHPSGKLFPGYYSWWGLVFDHDHVGMESLVSELRLFLANPPPYLKLPPQSIYGGNAFTIDFTNLLESYGSSRGCKQNEICLKIGGTLRYKREIGYVVIVCTTDERDREMLADFGPITCAPPTIFDPNGLVDYGGKVVDIDAEPKFTTRYIDADNSYETLSFAFFFPELQYLQCSEDTIERQPIKHDFCIRTKSPGYGEKWVCPDKIN